MVWQDPEDANHTAESGLSYQFAWQSEDMLKELERFWNMMKRRGLRWRCFNADLLDGFHGKHYETRLNDDGDGDRDEVIDNPNFIAGTGITITRDGSNLTWSATNNGDVVGPASATDNAYARYNLTTGKLIQNSLVTEDDSGTMTTLGRKQAAGEIDHTQDGYTLAANDWGVYCNTDTSSFGVNLPAAIAKTLYVVANIGSNTLTITPDGTEQINGATGAIMLASGEVRTLHAYKGGFWWII
jgi:hypothetical protein